MKERMFLHIILALLLASAADAEKYFVLNVNNILDSASFNSINLKEIDRAVKSTDTSGFLIKTVSFENSDIGRMHYNMPENKNYLIYIPYDENAARIEMYNLKNSKVMDIDVSSFADTCGNSKCEGHESHESCTKDCSSGSKDDFCDQIKEGICDPDCIPKLDSDCQTEKNVSESSGIPPKIQDKKEFNEEPGIGEKPNYLLWIAIGFAIIIPVLAFLFIRKRKENQTVLSLKSYIGENIGKGFTLQQIKDALYREGYSEKEVDNALKAT
ncbi:hypothetical protein HYV80_01965 [Candidatus Woesearchaeota archaeon]|nr:hypothetical protein [Candidatus Woesearchaeota archaeon]